MTGNAFGFVAAEAAYKGGQEWLDKVKKQIVDNDQYLRELFKENLPKVVVTPLEATYLVWIDLRAYIKPEDTKEFIQKKCRLAVDFGDWFGGDRFNGFIRMNLATSRENVEIGVKRIIDGILGEK
jgi:cystathionine beta-lyase